MSILELSSSCLCRPEVNIMPWDEQFRDIKNGSQRTKWLRRVPLAFWRGNPGVAAPIRTELLQCNDSMKWGAEILVQVWLDSFSEIIN